MERAQDLDLAQEQKKKGVVICHVLHRFPGKNVMMIIIQKTKVLLYSVQLLLGCDLAFRPPK